LNDGAIAKGRVEDPVATLTKGRNSPLAAKKVRGAERGAIVSSDVPSTKVTIGT
jgi:hypothetical protein